MSFHVGPLLNCHFLRSFAISSSVSLLTEKGEISAGDIFFQLCFCGWFFSELFLRFLRVPFAITFSVQFIAFVYPCYLLYFSQRLCKFSMFFELSQINKWCCTKYVCNPFRSCSGSNDVPKWFSAYYLCASWICPTGMSLNLILISFSANYRSRIVIGNSVN